MEPKKCPACWGCQVLFGLKAKGKTLLVSKRECKQLGSHNSHPHKNKLNTPFFQQKIEVAGHTAVSKIGETVNQSRSPGAKSSAGTSTRMGTLKLYLMKFWEAQYGQI